MDIDMHDHLLKVVVVGDSSVGKSCLLSRFVEGNFDWTYNSTIGVDFKIKTMVIDGKDVKLQIWDTAGQERFKTIVSSYYRGANIIFIVFDLGNAESFRNLDKWYQEATTMCLDSATLVLVGCKCDLPPAVTDKEVSEWSKNHGDITYCKCSALTGRGVKDVFQIATSKALKNIDLIRKGFQTLHIRDTNSTSADKSTDGCLHCTIL